jgi:hypothetical protein
MFLSCAIKIYGTPRLTIQDSCGKGFALIRHVINQMVIATGNAITVDEYIECDFSEFMAHNNNVVFNIFG